MSLIIGARKDQIAERVLLPGDPLRAKHIAENFLENVICYNEIRGMFGYTGFYKGERISVQGTGMGVPSISAYVNELIQTFNTKKLIRVGTCGTIQEKINLREIILAMSASTDSNLNNFNFPGYNYAPTADFNLLKKSYDLCLDRRVLFNVGSVLTTDHLFTDSTDKLAKFSKYGVLAVEMETAALYTISSKYKVQALSILTVSDHIFKEQSTSVEERQVSFGEMVKIALDTII